MADIVPPRPELDDDVLPALPRAPRSPIVTILLAVLILVFFTLFVSLGTWQVQRRAWKLDLIERVESRIHAPAVPAPPPERWAGVTAARDEYQPVRLRGRLLYDHEALVQAVSVLGAGFWVLTPLETADGSLVFVNRGFVPPERRDPARREEQRPEGWVEVTGLVRMPEPRGGFLRENDPAADRWYSRDVAAIAAARGLEAGRIAPYFIDLTSAPEALPAADAPAPEPPAWQPPPAQADEVAVHRWMATRRPGFPVSGLTVVSFSNSHLVYALTWYGLALLMAASGWLLYRDWRRRRDGTNTTAA